MTRSPGTGSTPIVAALALSVLFSAAAEAAGHDFTLVHTGETNGFLEPCGCDEDLLGGMTRRASALEAIRRRGGATVVVSNGDIVAAYGEQDEIKLGFILRAMSRMGYDLINLGERDLAWEAGVFDRHLKETGIRALRADRRPDFVRRVIGGVPVLIAAWFAQAAAGPEPALLDAVLEQAERGAFKVLLFHGSMDEAARLAEERPGFHVIIAGHGQEDAAAARRVGGTLVVNYGSKGKYLGVLEAAREAGGGFRIRHEVVKLDRSVPSSADMLALLAEYDAVLKEKDLVLKFSNRNPLQPGFRFQGNAKCVACHEGEHEVWAGSAHRRAYATLVAAGKTHDPECVACHTVGYGLVSGFSVPDKRPDLRGVGCESCHGPGYPHRKEPTEFRMTARKGACLESCHVMDHSPNFDLDVYWNMIRH